MESANNNNKALVPVFLRSAMNPEQDKIGHEFFSTKWSQQTQPQKINK